MATPPEAEWAMSRAYAVQLYNDPSSLPLNADVETYHTAEGVAGYRGITQSREDGSDNVHYTAVIAPKQPDRRGLEYAFVYASPRPEHRLPKAFFGYQDGKIVTSTFNEMEGRLNDCVVEFNEQTTQVHKAWLDSVFLSLNLMATPAPAPPIGDPTPDNTGSMPMDEDKPQTGTDPEAPGSFGAGIDGLPNEPGWFKTPAGYCRKWEPWERAILQAAQMKNKKEMEAYMNKYDCMPPRTRCKVTTRY